MRLFNLIYLLTCWVFSDAFLLSAILSSVHKYQRRSLKWACLIGLSVYRCNEGVLCERKTSYSTSSIFLKLCCVFCSWSENVHVVNNKKKIG